MTETLEQRIARLRDENSPPRASWDIVADMMQVINELERRLTIANEAMELIQSRHKTDTFYGNTMDTVREALAQTRLDGKENGECA